jgi:hypothetical protein
VDACRVAHISPGRVPQNQEQNHHADDEERNPEPPEEHIAVASPRLEPQALQLRVVLRLPSGPEGRAALRAEGIGPQVHVLVERDALDRREPPQVVALLPPDAQELDDYPSQPGDNEREEQQLL